MAKKAKASKKREVVDEEPDEDVVYYCVEVTRAHCVSHPKHDHAAHAGERIVLTADDATKFSNACRKIDKVDADYDPVHQTHTKPRKKKKDEEEE